MIVNGLLVAPANLADELDPGEPGWTPRYSAMRKEYLTAEQKEILREAGRLESCARQELALLDAANGMSAATGRLARNFVELAAIGTIYPTMIEATMLDIEASAAKMLFAMQELRYQIDGVSKRDVIGGVLQKVDFFIQNKQRALEFEKKENKRDE